MYLTATASEITIGQASLYALLGYVIVFFGLILLMLVVVLLGKFFVAVTRRSQEVPEKPAEEVAPPTAAPGAAGQLKLYNVDPKTAAILMAITVDKMGKPINELRFISVREVTE